MTSLTIKFSSIIAFCLGSVFLFFIFINYRPAAIKSHVEIQNGKNKRKRKAKGKIQQRDSDRISSPAGGAVLTVLVVVLGWRGTTHI